MNIRFIGGEFGQNTGDGLQFNNNDFCVIGVRQRRDWQERRETLDTGVNVNLTTRQIFHRDRQRSTGNVLGAFNNASTQINWISGQNIADTGKFRFRGKTMTADFSQVARTRGIVASGTVNGLDAVLARKPNGTSTTGAIGAGLQQL